jgi:hypothetical protein
MAEYLERLEEAFWCSWVWEKEMERVISLF